MSLYYFQIIDHTGEVHEKTASEFDTLDAAKADARAALSTIAGEGLPGQALNMLSIEVFDQDQKPLVVFRLIFEEIEK
jgi:hypothetical protein